MHLCTHGNASPAVGEGTANTIKTEDGTASREVWAVHELHEIVHRDRINAAVLFDEEDGCIANLGQVVRWNVGRHGYSNAGDAIEQQYWIERDMHCWTVRMGMDVDENNTRSFWMAFTLKAFPDIGFDFHKRRERLSKY